VLNPSAEQEAAWAEQRRWCEARYWLKKTGGQKKKVLALMEDLRRHRSEDAIKMLVDDMRTVWKEDKLTTPSE